MILSIVIPCYNEQELLKDFFSVLNEFIKTIDAEKEVIFVDDGSRDNTLSILRELHAGYTWVKYVSLSRNFGKEAAIFAGLEASCGDYIAVMDADLQDPPELLKQMWDRLSENTCDCDCVAARRRNREGEPWLRSFFAKRFYTLINKLSNTSIPEGARDYRMMSRRMVNAVVQDREYNRFSKGIFAWVGFNTEWIEFDHVDRQAGRTKWSFLRLLTYAVDGIIAYSAFPLALVSIVGFIFFVIALIGLVFVVIRALLFGDPVAGWPSMVSIMLLLGALLLLSQGIVGIYVARIYTETKNRQIYIVKEKSSD